MAVKFGDSQTISRTGFVLSGRRGTTHFEDSYRQAARPAIQSPHRTVECFDKALLGMMVNWSKLNRKRQRFQPSHSSTHKNMPPKLTLMSNRIKRSFLLRSNVPNLTLRNGVAEGVPCVSIKDPEGPAAKLGVGMPNILGSL